MPSVPQPPGRHRSIEDSRGIDPRDPVDAARYAFRPLVYFSTRARIPDIEKAFLNFGETRLECLRNTHNRRNTRILKEISAHIERYFDDRRYGSLPGRHQGVV